MSFEILCSKGSADNEIIRVTDLDLKDLANKKLSDLRSLLERKKVGKENFIVPDSSTFQYRFVFPSAECDAENYSDRIVGLTSEKMIVLSNMFINEKNQIVLTNTKKAKKPDLVGFASDCWAQGKLRVRCRLNRDNEIREKNKGKFEPVMLTNVVPTNQSIQLHYDNVCICCEDSIVEFPIDCYGTVGFGFKAQLASGDIVRESCMHWKTGDKKLYGGATINFWDTKDGTREIVVKAIEHVSGIDPATKMTYQKLTFTARDMLSWVDGDEGEKVIDVNTPPKNLFLRNYGLGDMSNDLAGQQITTDGKIITPATLQPGDKVDVKYGNWWPKEFASWDDTLGVVNVYLFVFTNITDAKKFIDQYNILAPNLQEKFWF